NRSATTCSPASEKPNPTAGTARPRVSKSASPAPTPNSPKWTRSAPAAPQPSNSASPASPTPPDVPLSLQTSETSSDTTKHELNIQDQFSSEKTSSTRCGWPSPPRKACCG